MRHPYHIVTISPWPILLSFNLLFLMISFIGTFAGISFSPKLLLFQFILFCYILYLWLYDVVIESFYLGNHNVLVSKSLIFGFLLFVLTEVMLFLSLFWAYFHAALNPYYLIWPPMGIDIVNPWSIPLLNTFLLLYSGIIATYAHHSFIALNRTNALEGIGLTILLGTLFFGFQVFEYFNSSFDITDSVYGTTFFMLTGAHGFHVIVGTIFFIFTYIRINNYHNSYLLFDLTILYWHFVDIVWIGLFILIYYMAY